MAVDGKLPKMTPPSKVGEWSLQVLQWQAVVLTGATEAVHDVAPQGQRPCNEPESEDGVAEAIGGHSIEGVVA